VIIPAGFSGSVLPGDWAAATAESGPVAVEVYGRPEARYSTLVVQSIVSQVVGRMSTVTRGISAAVAHLAVPGAGMAGATLQPETLAADLTEFGQAVGRDLSDGQSLVQLQVSTAGGRSFSWLDYMAGTMAVLFLMFSVTAVAHHIGRVEQGTLSA
jgi:hypothetical protein